MLMFMGLPIYLQWLSLSLFLIRDGLGRSGTFCALYSVRERLKIEQVVDVFQAIKAMRIPRPGLVRTAVSRALYVKRN